MKITKYLIISFSLALFLVPSLAYMQAPFVNCTGLNCTFTDLMKLPVRVFNWLLNFAGIVFIGVIIWGGIRMITFYVSEQPESELMNAKLTITRGIFGFLIIAFSYLIINILAYKVLGINPGGMVGDYLSTFGFGVL